MSKSSQNSRSISLEIRPVPQMRMPFLPLLMSTAWGCILCYTKNEAYSLVCTFCSAEPLPSVASPAFLQTTVPQDSPPPLATRASSSSMSSFFWQCRQCTLHNSFKTSTCEGCGRDRFQNKRHRVPRTSSSSSLAELDAHEPVIKKPKLIESDSWTCRFCTLENRGDANECQCCESPKIAPKPTVTSAVPKQGPRLIIIDEDDDGNDCQDLSSPVTGFRSGTTTEPEALSSFNHSLSGSRSAKFSGLEIPVELQFSDALKGACVQCEVCGCEFLLDDLESLNEHAALHASGPSRQKTSSGSGSSSSEAILIDDIARDAWIYTREEALGSTLDDKGAPVISSQRRVASDATVRVRLDTAYEQQYARSFGRAFKSTLSSSQITDHLREMSKKVTSTEEDIEDAEKSAMLALEEHYRLFPRTGRDVILATTKLIHMSSGYGDKGWGCGYRNIQMLSSALMALPHFQQSLFGGIGHGIPSILLLQQCLEAAWADGFDPGSTNRAEGVYGGNSWIGTYDAVALLRHFGVPMELQSFGAIKRTDSVTSSKPGSAGRTLNGATIISSHFGNPLTSSGEDSGSSTPSEYGRNVSGSRVVGLKDILAQDKAASSFKFRRFQPALFVPHVEMFNWIWNYFFNARQRQRDAGVPIMPLYLQHDGHSRTIVGVERQNGRIALLLFDPSFHAHQLPHTFRTKEIIPDVVRKTLSEFRHENYQIAYVPDPSTTIPPHKRDLSKTIRQPRMILSR